MPNDENSNCAFVGFILQLIYKIVDLELFAAQPRSFTKVPCFQWYFRLDSVEVNYMQFMNLQFRYLFYTTWSTSSRGDAKVTRFVFFAVLFQ